MSLSRLSVSSLEDPPQLSVYQRMGYRLVLSRALPGVVVFVLLTSSTAGGGSALAAFSAFAFAESLDFGIAIGFAGASVGPVAALFDRGGILTCSVCRGKSLCLAVTMNKVESCPIEK